MNAEANRAIARRFFDEAVNQARIDVLDEIVAQDFVLHSAVLGEVHGRDAYVKSVARLLAAAPDLQGRVDDLLVAERDMVVARVTYRGTDRGGILPGQPGTNKGFEFTAIYIFQVRDGRLAELWQEADLRRAAQQLAN